jgi:hypothetical protein
MLMGADDHCYQCVWECGFAGLSIGGKEADVDGKASEVKGWVVCKNMQLLKKRDVKVRCKTLSVL